MSQQPEQPPFDPSDQHSVVVGPDGQPVPAFSTGNALPVVRSEDQADGPAVGGLSDLVEQPAKVMRIGTMIKQLLDEVRQSPLDEAGRDRLKEIHRRSIAELETGLAPELVDELERLSLPFTEDRTPSEPELRIAQAQLVGWLEGLFHGVQTALFAQQMAARAQFEEMRRQAALPPGMRGADGQGPPPATASGPYL